MKESVGCDLSIGDVVLLSDGSLAKVCDVRRGYTIAYRLNNKNEPYGDAIILHPLAVHTVVDR